MSTIVPVNKTISNTALIGAGVFLVVQELHHANEFFAVKHLCFNFFIERGNFGLNGKQSGQKYEKSPSNGCIEGPTYRNSKERLL